MLSPAPTLKKLQRWSPMYIFDGPLPLRSIHTVRFSSGDSM